jgi:hypothetical protein
MIRISFQTLSVGLIALASMLAAPSAADASTLTYTATGGIITGTLGGTPFTDATWSITGTADPTNVVTGTYLGFFPFNFLAMTPLLTITTGSSTLQATVLTSGSTGQQVGVYSVDASLVQSGRGFGGFGYLEGDGSTLFSDSLGLVGLGLYTDLQSPLSGSGEQRAQGSFNTNIGLFDVIQPTNQDATFTVSGGSPSSVPEIDPNSLGSVLALVLGSLGLLERRRLFPCKPEAQARGIRVAFP